MPRYFFHLIDDLDCPDAEGAEFPDLDAAKAYGARGAVSLMADLLMRERRVALHHRIDIEDEQSEIVASLEFRDIVSIED